MIIFRIVQAPFIFLTVFIGYLLIGVLTAFLSAHLYVKGKIDWSEGVAGIRRILEEET